MGGIDFKHYFKHSGELFPRIPAPSTTLVLHHKSSGQYKASYHVVLTDLLERPTQQHGLFKIPLCADAQGKETT